jgi:hypothetical protein
VASFWVTFSAQHPKDGGDAKTKAGGKGGEKQIVQQIVFTWKNIPELQVVCGSCNGYARIVEKQCEYDCCKYAHNAACPKCPFPQRFFGENRFGGSEGEHRPNGFLHIAQIKNQYS